MAYQDEYYRNGQRRFNRMEMTQVSREFQIFVKPVGPTCNLRCNYCYYLGRKKLYPGITNRASLKHIASYLGTTQVSISRIRAGKQ